MLPTHLSLRKKVARFCLVRYLWTSLYSHCSGIQSISDQWFKAVTLSIHYSRTPLVRWPPLKPSILTKRNILRPTFYLAEHLAIFLILLFIVHLSRAGIHPLSSCGSAEPLDSWATDCGARHYVGVFFSFSSYSGKSFIRSPSYYNGKGLIRMSHRRFEVSKLAYMCQTQSYFKGL